jgi:hypothetical protein
VFTVCTQLSELETIYGYLITILYHFYNPVRESWIQVTILLHYGHVSQSGYFYDKYAQKIYGEDAMAQ